MVQNKHTWQLENEEGNEIDPHRKSQIAQQSNCLAIKIVRQSNQKIGKSQITQQSNCGQIAWQ